MMKRSTALTTAALMGVGVYLLCAASPGATFAHVSRHTLAELVSQSDAIVIGQLTHAGPSDLQFTPQEFIAGKISGAESGVTVTFREGLALPISEGGTYLWFLKTDTDRVTLVLDELGMRPVEGERDEYVAATRRIAAILAIPEKLAASEEDARKAALRESLDAQLLSCLRSRSEEERVSALVIIGTPARFGVRLRPSEQMTSQIISFLSPGRGSQIRVLAMQALAATGDRRDERIAQAIRSSCDDRDAAVRFVADQTLKKLKGQAGGCAQSAAPEQRKSSP